MPKLIRLSSTNVEAYSNHSCNGTLLNFNYSCSFRRNCSTSEPLPAKGLGWFSEIFVLADGVIRSWEDGVIYSALSWEFKLGSLLPGCPGSREIIGACWDVFALCVALALTAAVAIATIWGLFAAIASATILSVSSAKVLFPRAACWRAGQTS